MIDLNKNNVPDSKKFNAKESNANKFLCIVLACITVFISVVCVAVNSRNKTLLANQTLAAAGQTDISENANVSAPDTTAAPNTEKAPSIVKITTEPSTQEQTTAGTSDSPIVKIEGNGVNANTGAPGTINNPTIITIDESNWQLTLVNSCYRIPDSYSPDLVYVCGSGERLDRKIASHYEEMYRAAAADGVTLTPCSGYRSYETQERNYNRKIEFFEGQGYSREEAKVKAATIIMPPGSSEHNLGYAMDIVCVEEWFEDTAEFRWLQENAADYGFILRYPKDKQDITKVIYEPWHWRYVGVENAKAIKSSGLVLEEYLGVA